MKDILAVRRTNNKAVKGFPARLVDVDSANTTLLAAAPVKEPDGVLWVVDDDLEVSDGGAVHCIAKARVETIDALVREMGWDTRRGESALNCGVVPLGDCLRAYLSLGLFIERTGLTVEEDDVAPGCDDGLWPENSRCVLGDVADASDGDNYGLCADREHG